jgi:MoaA/NifB/PqqE/SkfB family radical SAM enzyme
MNYINTVKSIQLEIGSNCNLKCTGCARINKEDLETTTSLLKKNVFLDINLIKELLNSKYLQNLNFQSIMSEL